MKTVVVRVDSWLDATLGKAIHEICTISGINGKDHTRILLRPNHAEFGWIAEILEEGEQAVVKKIGQSTDITAVGKAALKIRGVLLMPLVQMASTPGGYWDGFEERLLADGILFAWKRDGAAEFVAT